MPNPANSISQAKRVAQDIVALHRADGGFAAPALAAHFAGRGCAMCGSSIGKVLTQIKVASNAFVVEAIEAKHRLGVGEVDLVLDLTAPRDTFGIVVRQIHCQGLQARKLVSEAG